jgi:hypothetical protein
MSFFKNRFGCQSDIRKEELSFILVKLHTYSTLMPTRHIVTLARLAWPQPGLKFQATQYTNTLKTLEKNRSDKMESR